MKWSWKIARVAGIDIYLHATFLILIIWLGFHFWLVEGTVSAVINGIGFILSLFACVVLHEFGHALTARRYGIRTRHITLFPIGGVAMLEKMPDQPTQEIKVALAGPAVNFVIAFVLWLVADPGVSAVAPAPEEIDITRHSFTERLMAVNIILAVFNLLPAFPMDGGRVLRAVLAMRMDRVHATRVAATVGQALAFGLGLLGLFYNPFLLFISLFVWIGAAAESVSEEFKSSLQGATAGQAMLTDFHSLSVNDSLAKAIELTLAGSQKDFPVESEQGLEGVLTQTALLRALHQQGSHSSIRDLQLAALPVSDVDEPLDQLMERMQGRGIPLVAVRDAGKFVGIVDLDNIVELVKIQNALKSHRHSRVF
jgi:Zn-dependent protease/CBS domain-containing protein